MTVSDRLTKLMLSYSREAHKCASGKAYVAATVMQVAALEAGLQAMCLLYPHEVKKTSVFAKKRFHGKRNKALEFSLYQLINVAEEAGWFPAKQITWAGRRATVGGFSHDIRKVRNFVHPGVWARERSNPLKFTKGVYGVVYEVIDVANSWLLHRVEKSLQKAMAREKSASERPETGHRFHKVWLWSETC